MAVDVNPNEIEYLVPISSAAVFKDECGFCFDSPDSAGTGLYVCLMCHVGFCRTHLSLHAETRKHLGYLNYVREKRQIFEEDDAPPRQITKLAIGVQGGFLEKQYDVRERWAVTVYPDLKLLTLAESTLGPGLMYCCKKLMEAESAYRVLEVQSLAGTWDGTVLANTVHTDLHQVPDPPKIPASGWKCAVEGCDKVENLWMNLSDGMILCGRKYFDGSGGNNHGMDHFCKTNYPLAVKLGTISARGADVVSYDEDELVNDPLLETHLLHFGIDMKAMEKTEKSMIEMELDYNQKWQFREIQEEGQKLTPLYGAGRTGMVNMGNSCYLNSVMQCVYVVDPLREVYLQAADSIFRSCAGVPTDDFNVQLAKLLCGLHSGAYSKEGAADNGIRPASFRLIINRGNTEFASNRQQDVEEFMRYLFERIEDSQRNLPIANQPIDLIRPWRFCLEEKLTCPLTSRSSFTQRPEVILSLPVPQQDSSTQDAVNGLPSNDIAQPAGGKQRLHVSLMDCLNAFVEAEVLENSSSPFTGEKTFMTKELRFNTFPKWLWIQIKKFTFTAYWEPVKLDVSLDVPDVLNLSQFRASGPHVGKLFIENDDAIKPDPANVQQLCDMGFEVSLVSKALIESKNKVEEAVLWLLNQAAIAGSNLTAAAADQQLAGIDGVDATHRAQFDDSTDGIYELRGFISHTGRSTHTGHYVCYLLKDRVWVMFNDEKVMQCEKPPKGLGYVYLYERIGTPQFLHSDCS